MRNDVRRPIGIWIIAAVFTLLPVLVLYLAADQLIDPGISDSHRYTMWQIGTGPYIVAHAVLMLISAVALFAGKRVGRTGILVALSVALCAAIYEAYLAFVFVYEEYPEEIWSVGFWSRAARFPLVVLATFVCLAWYLFGARTKAFFAAGGPSRTES